MIRTFVSRRQIHVSLYFAALLLFAFLTASCCPPALLERAPKQMQKSIVAAQFEEQKLPLKK